MSVCNSVSYWTLKWNSVFVQRRHNKSRKPLALLESEWPPGASARVEVIVSLVSNTQ